jgi:hypothetical protein
MSDRPLKTRRISLRLGASGAVAPPRPGAALPPEQEALLEFLLAIETVCPECVRELANAAGESNLSFETYETWRRRWRLSEENWRDWKSDGNFDIALCLILHCWRGSLADNCGFPLLNGRRLPGGVNGRGVAEALREEGTSFRARGSWAGVLRLAVGNEKDIKFWRAEWAGEPPAYFLFDPLDLNRNGIWSPPNPIREKRAQGIARLRRHFPHGEKKTADKLWDESQAQLLASGATVPGAPGTPLLEDFLVLARYQVVGESLNGIAGYKPHSRSFPLTQRARASRDRAASAVGLVLRKPSGRGRSR